MSKRKNPLETTKCEEYFSCGRCRIDSLTNGRMCPCPRGGCEAKIKGSVVTVTKRTIYLRK